MLNNMDHFLKKLQNTFTEESWQNVPFLTQNKVRDEMPTQYEKSFIQHLDELFAQSYSQ